MLFRSLDELGHIGKSQLNVCQGSQWWSMPRLLAEYATERLTSDRQLELSFRYSAIPDESVFQTIVAEKFGPNDDTAVDGCPMLVDFEQDPKPFVFENREQVLASGSTEWLRNSLFVRKVSPPFARSLREQPWHPYRP